MSRVCFCALTSYHCHMSGHTCRMVMCWHSDRKFVSDKCMHYQTVSKGFRIPKRCTAELGRLPDRRGAWLRMRFWSRVPQPTGATSFYFPERQFHIRDPTPITLFRSLPVSTAHPISLESFPYGQKTPFFCFKVSEMRLKALASGALDAENR